MRRYRMLPATLAAVAVCLMCEPAFAMDAPGSGGANWYYSQKSHCWYYHDENENVHKGWLNYEGEWYWFDSEGRMTDGGYEGMDDRRYYFFVNGHMAWNQYVGLKYFNGDGQEDRDHDIRVIGKQSPTSEDRDLITDYLYEIPRSWIACFVKDGWELMFYKKKSYFAAPSTDMGIYYVRHSVDTHYKKVKFTDADAVLQGFGEYVGYRAGCYQSGDERMKKLWNDFPALRNILEIPDYYADNPQFYFGKIFAGYVSGELRDEMIHHTPETCEVLEEILHLQDDEETRLRLQTQREAARKERREHEALAAKAEGYGPGYKRPKEEVEDGQP